jgi:ArsR family transcriptional regulator
MEREFCVCELERILDEPQYKVSRHLGILKRAGLIDDWREGTWMHYQVAPTLAYEWRMVLDALRVVWDQSAEVQADRVRLHQQDIRQPGEPVVCSI